MKNLKFSLLSIIFLGIYSFADSAPIVTNIMAIAIPTIVQHDAGQNGETLNSSESSKEGDVGTTGVIASWDKFPNLHPMVVHFPIVLLLIAFISQLIGLFVITKELSWVTLVLLFLAVVGGFVAAKITHAHPHDLPERILQIFEEHEWYANATLWISSIALVLKIVSHFYIKNNRWLEIFLTIVIFLSAITVSLTGHLGSQLVHIENVGPQGNYLENNHEH